MTHIHTPILPIAVCLSVRGVRLSVRGVRLSVRGVCLSASRVCVWLRGLGVGLGAG
jgi:hypothetical protein